MNSNNKNNNSDELIIFLFSLFFSIVAYFAVDNIFSNSGIALIKNLYTEYRISVTKYENFAVDNKAVVKIDQDEMLDESYYETLNSSPETYTESSEITLTSSEEDIKAEKDILEQDLSVKHVIPCGMTIGVRIDTEGIMVLGTGYVNGEDGSTHKPCEGILYPGDLILTMNGKDINKKEDLAYEIENAENEIYIKIKRDEDIIEEKILPVKGVEDGKNKIGIWVRDSTQGIGTITYYDPSSRKFAALGHGILDVDTKQLMTVKQGDVMETNIKSVKKGKKGSPGELIGDINTDEIIGSVKLNNEYGLFGNLDEEIISELGRPIPIGSQNEVHEGNAIILSNIEGMEVKEYEVIIEAVNKNSDDDSKGMVIRIVDENLLSKTNGIVQGMSGSPIIQDGKLIGAVTHVFVQDPAKGYGIFIEKMIDQEKSI